MHGFPWFNCLDPERAFLVVECRLRRFSLAVTRIRVRDRRRECFRFAFAAVGVGDGRKHCLRFAFTSFSPRSKAWVENGPTQSGRDRQL